VTEFDAIEDLLSCWARWQRASAAERLALWYPQQVSWAEGAKSNYMTAETDSADLWDARHSQRMMAVQAAIEDLPRRLQSAIHQSMGIGTLGQPRLREMELQLVFDMAVLELVPRLEDRGFLV
jgi:hypothetical protein